MSNIDKLASLIGINIDSDSIRIYNEQLYNCTLLDTKKIAQWLYCVLHARNPFLMKQTTGILLENEIRNSVDESKIIIRGDQSSFYHVSSINISGIRVFSEGKDFIEISKFRPNLTPGFFMYMNSVSEGKILNNTDRYYIYSSVPSNAIEIWSNIIVGLEDNNVPFTIKVLSSTSSYPRTDAIVVYSTKKYSEIVKQKVLEVSSALSCEGNNEYISPLCKKLSNIVSYAEQPTYKGKNISFGEDRCEIIASAIKDSLNFNLDFKLLLQKRFENLQIDPSKIYKER